MIPVADSSYAAPMYDNELGVGSPEALAIELEYSHSLSLRYHRPFSIVVVDLDYFEQYEAQYGTKAAKLAHKLMAEHMRHTCRTVDRIYRCNSAESCLLLLLPETDFKGAAILSERIVDSFAKRKIAHNKSEYEVLTISASIAACDDSEEVPESSSEMFDEALLYVRVAQGQGGNRICHKALIADAEY